MKVNNLLLLPFSIFLLAVIPVRAQSDTLTCEIFGAIGNLFNEFIAGLGNFEISGTSADVPFPYDELIIIGIQPPAFNGCNVTVRIDLVLTSEIATAADSPGYADIEGRWDQSALFDLQFCIQGLKVTELDLKNEPEIIENFVEDYINKQFNDPECADLLGSDEDEDKSSTPSLNPTSAPVPALTPVTPTNPTTVLPGNI